MGRHFDIASLGHQGLQHRPYFLGRGLLQKDHLGSHPRGNCPPTVHRHAPGGRLVGGHDII